MEDDNNNSFPYSHLSRTGFRCGLVPGTKCLVLGGWRLMCGGGRSEMLWTRNATFPTADMDGNESVRIVRRDHKREAEKERTRAPNFVKDVNVTGDEAFENGRAGRGVR